MKAIYRGLLALLVSTIVLFTANSQTTTFTGAVDSDWHTAGNWDAGVPTAASTAVIGASLTVNTGGTAVTVAQLTMSSGATLQLGSASFSVTGTSSLQGTVTDNTSGGTNTFNGATAIDGNLTFSGNQPIIFNAAVTLNSSATVTNNNTQVMPVQSLGSPTNGISIPTSGGVPAPFDNDGGIVIRAGITGTGSWVQGTNASLSYVLNNSGGAVAWGTGVGLNASATGNTIRFYATAAGGINVPDFSYYNLQTCTSNNTCTYTISADRSVAGTWTHDGGRMDVRTLAASPSDRVLTVNNLTVRALNNAQRLLRVVANTRNCTLRISGVLTRAATTSTNTGQAIDGANASNRIEMLSGSTFRLERDGGVISNTNIIWSAGSVVEYTGGVTALPVNIGQTFSNFIWNCPNQTSTTLKLAGITNVNQALRIYNTGSGTLNIGVAESKTFNLSDFEVRSGANVAMTNTSGSSTLNVSDSLKLSGGSITNGPGTGLISMNGTTSTQRITTGTTLSGNLNLSMTGNQTVELLGNLSLPNNLTVSSGQLSFAGAARSLSIGGNLSIASGATFEMTGFAHNLTLSAGFTNSGTFTAGTATTTTYAQAAAGQTVLAANYGNLTFTGDTKALPAGTIGVAGTFNPNTPASPHTVNAANVVNFNGSSPQNVPALFGDYAGLTISNSASLTGSTTVTAALNLSAALALSNFTLTLGNAATISGSATGRVNITGSGSLVKLGATAADFVRTYHIGTTSGYSPINLSALTAAVTSGTLTITTTASKHPSAGSAAANRYWTISSTGITVTSADLSFSYNDPGDVGGGAASNYVLRYWDGGAWQTPTAASAAGVNPATTVGNGNLDGAWTVGETSAFSSITTYTSQGSGDWFTPASWSPTGVPSAADNAVIQSGHTISLGSNGASANSVTLNGTLSVGATTGHSFSLLNGTGTLAVQPANIPSITDFSAFAGASGGTLRLISSGTYPASWASAHNLEIASGATITRTGTITLSNNLTVDATANLSITSLNLDGNLTNNGSLSVTTLDLTGGSKTISGSAAVSVTNLVVDGSYAVNNNLTAQNTSGAGSLSLATGGNITFNGTNSGSVSFTSAASGTTATYAGGAGQTVYAGTYHNLTTSASGKTFVTGTYTITGTFSPGVATGHTLGTTTFSFTGATGQLVPAFEYHHINTSGPAKTLQSSGTISLTGDFTNSTILNTTGSTVAYVGTAGQLIADAAYNNLTVANSSGTSTWTLVGSKTISGTISKSGSGSLDIAGSTLTCSNVVNLSNGNLIVNASGSLTITGTVNVTGGILVNNGSLTFNGGSVYNHNRNGGTIPTATWQPTSLCKLSGITNTAPTIPNQTYGLFEVDNSGQTIDLGFNSGGPVMSGLTITNTNGMLYTMSGGGTSFATINGNVTVGSAGRFAPFNLNSGNTSTITINGNLTINGTMDLAARTGNTGIFNVSGNVNVASGGSLIATNGGSSRIALVGSSDANLAVTGTHTSGTVEFGKTAPGKVNINANTTLRNVTFTSGGYALASGITLSIKNNTTVAGTVTYNGHSTGTLLFDGSTAQTISGAGSLGASNVTFNNGSGVTLTSSLRLLGAFTNTSGFSAGAGSTVAFEGTGAQSIASVNNPQQFVNLTIGSGTGSVSSSVGINVSGNLSLSSRLAQGSQALTLNGTGAQTITGTATLNNLTNNNATSAVTVDAGASVNITDVLTLGTSSTLTNNGTVTLKSVLGNTARLAQVPSNATLNGDLTVERRVNNTSAWYFLTSPVKTTQLSAWSPYINYKGFTGAAAGNPNVYFYDEASSVNNGWTAATNITNSISGRGARIYLDNTMGNSRTLVSTGAPVIGNGADATNTGGAEAYNYAPTFTVSGFDGGGWNLLGNPYPSAIDWDAASGWSDRVAGNIDATIYVWNATTSSYNTYNYNTNLGSPMTFTGRIPMGQAFFVKANGGSPALTSTEAVKVSGTPNIMRQGNTISPIRITLSTNGMPDDEAILGFDQAATRGFDQQFDAHKLAGAYNSLSILISGNRQLATQIMPLLSHDSIPLRIWAARSGVYTITLDGLSSQPNGLGVGLFNKRTGAIHPVQEGSPISINLLAGASTDYVLVTNAQVTSLDQPVQAVNVEVYPNPANQGGEVTIAISGQATVNMMEITLLDAAGKVVLNQQVTAPAGHAQLKLPVEQAGLYFLKTKAGGYTQTSRLVIR